MLQYFETSRLGRGFAESALLIELERFPRLTLLAKLALYIESDLNPLLAGID
jgi:hypothetical protein